MIRALVVKELREHVWVYVALLALQAFTLLGLLINARDDGSVFTALRQFTLTLGILGVLIANNRLVVREYTGRTQLFLETLPVTRLRVLTVKLLLGLASVWGPVAIVVATCALLAQNSEPITARYLAIVSARAGVFLLTLHGFGFLAAMLGRYRYVFWAAVIFAWAYIDKKENAGGEFPLARLMNEKMPFERNVFPWFDLGTMTAVALVCIAIGFVLGITQEGGLAANLARKMSHREKVFFGGLALIIIVLDNTMNERRARPLFELAKAMRANAGSTFVGIATGTDDEASLAPAKEVGNALAADLESMRVWLDLRELPPVFVVPDSSLDPDELLRAKLEDTDGVVLKAPLADPRLDPAAFRAFAIDEVLAWYSRGRSRREAVAWFSSGFARWWVDRQKPDERLGVRAAAAPNWAVTAESLRDWLTTRERLGPCVAGAVEALLVDALAQQDADKFQLLARSVLGGPRPGQDFRATLFRKGIDVDVPALVTAYTQRIEAERLKFLGSLDTRRRLVSHLTPKAVGRGSGFEIHHSVEDSSGLPVEYTVRYAALRPWAGPQFDALRFTTQGSGVLPQVFPRGTRLFSAFEIDDAVLACSIRLGAQRSELQ